MSVHTSGALRPTDSDLLIIHRGTSVMLKCFHWPGGLPGIALSELRGSAWENFAVLYEFSDGEIARIASAPGGMMGWIKDTLLPLINAALGERFRAGGVEAAPVVAGTFEEVDALLSSMLVWQPQPDGTLRMAVK